MLGSHFVEAHVPTISLPSSCRLLFFSRLLLPPGSNEGNFFSSLVRSAKSKKTFQISHMKKKKKKKKKKIEEIFSP